MSTEPINRRVTVRRSGGDAFRLFTEGMGSWWPVETHGRMEEGEKLERLVVEPHEGGRVYELTSAGRELDWATITAWEPPTRLMMAWNTSAEDRPRTEVEVRFRDLGDGTTEVNLEHRRWELLAERAPELRGSYASERGWDLVLGAYVEDAGAAA